MRMRLLVCVTTILLAGTAWAQQMCPDPNSCAGCGLPMECCQNGGVLALECSGGGQPHFVITTNPNLLLTETSGVDANFSVAGKTVNVTIGNVAFAPFVIGTSEKRVRFTTQNGGQCVEVKNLQGFVNPSPIVVDMRALDVQKKAFFCDEPTGDLICFKVTGQVGPPFPANDCPNGADRVEYACGTPILS